MNRIFSMASLLSGAVIAVTLSGCVVTPPTVRPAYVAPPGVVYVAPSYPQPAVGYVWAYHPHYGWGWHHPQYGWHQGWR
ncbi:hypothetical protein FHW67_002840 [Herbaspirillum sp. Sphag1AN]|uniref:hypothetical protein n=1 Tax=unclassified Herbaspirillum TaxID=2624150 RepID=UPI00161B5AA0|nr:MULTISPECIES: hypothetical protein [unclassified Herbaspirillum]MBB3213542.1 hypothetical protein [Herbaspirillum sp. Sphag1AN]MBB3246740.1 hypothetical protein [Herbaspirillum sp. Sphag64]